jgi:S-(hydroxymethyl)glutathione dehydrogenase/alcohol dehydrogenase
MRALVMRGERDMRLEELDFPEPGPNDVRVQMVTSGVCHTNLTVLNGAVRVPTPIVLGHEGAGIVTGLECIASTR